MKEGCYYKWCALLVHLSARIIDHRTENSSIAGRPSSIIFIVSLTTIFSMVTPSPSYLVETHLSLPKNYHLGLKMALGSGQSPFFRETWTSTCSLTALPAICLVVSSSE